MPRGVIPNLGTRPGFAPDIQGFKDAQERLTSAVGEKVRFLVPVARVYAPGVQLDPETGEPYDPLIQPVQGGGYDEVEVTVTIARQMPVGTDDNVTEGPGGVRDDDSPAFLVMERDYPAIQNASRVRWQGAEYTITKMQPSGLTQTMRYIVYTEAT